MRYLTLGEVVKLHRRVLAATGGAPGVLGFALAQGHPFVDGNKRVAHAAMATFLRLNGADTEATVDEQERLMLDLASGRVSRTELVEWLREHITRQSDQAV